MSFDAVIDKLLQSLKDELDKDKNKEFIEQELLKPIIHKVLDQLYPYFMGHGYFGHWHSIIWRSKSQITLMHRPKYS